MPKKLSNGFTIYSSLDLEYLTQSATILKAAREEAIKYLKPGVTTLELDQIVENFIISAGAEPLFKGFESYPYSTCISAREDIVHGLPNTLPLEAGDVVSLDIGVKYKGYCSDSARTYIIGDNTKTDHEDLIEVAEKAFSKAFKILKPGVTTGTVGFTVHKEVLSYLNKPGDWSSGHKFKIFPQFQGHGIGLELHESPPVPNLGEIGKGDLILPGMCFCIEPVVIYSSSNVIKANVNGVLQFKTDNCLPSSHYENQVFMSYNGPIILT